MIALRDDCLLVEDPKGTTLPCSVEHLTLEFVGQTADTLDPEVLKEAAAAVLHYFKHDQGRQFVTVGEFAAALAKVLDGFGIDAKVTDVHDGTRIRTADLRTLASDAGKLGELEFFTLLKSTLREQLAGRPMRVEFRGLRSCVKQLTGRKHWCPECDRLEDWIISVLRGWFEKQPEAGNTALIVR